MPVDTTLEKEGMIYQRDQYAKGSLGVRYWDYRDRVAFQHIIGNDILDAGCGEELAAGKRIQVRSGTSLTPGRRWLVSKSAMAIRFCSGCSAFCIDELPS